MRRRVRFYEVDGAGIVHFSWFFRYMEEAEYELWRSAGLRAAARESLQVIDVRCEPVEVRRPAHRDVDVTAPRKLDAGIGKLRKPQQRRR